MSKPAAAGRSPFRLGVGFYALAVVDFGCIVTSCLANGFLLMFRFEEVTTAPYDCIVELIGGDYEERSLPLLAPRGHFANVFNATLSLSFLYKTLSRMLRSFLRIGPSYSLVIIKPKAALGLTQVGGMSESRVQGEGFRVVGFRFLI